MVRNELRVACLHNFRSLGSTQKDGAAEPSTSQDTLYQLYVESSDSRSDSVSGMSPSVSGVVGDVSRAVAPVGSAPPPLVSYRSFLLLFVPIIALVAALAVGQFVYLDYVHVITGGLWTGIDVFMGLVIGPILGRMSGPARADFVQRLVPTMLFLMPALASVAITAGIYLAINVGIFDLHYVAIQLAGIFVIVLAGQGFGVFLPNELRIVLELRKAKPDILKIGRLGLLNARLAGVQAVFQIALIFVMASLASGLVNL